MRMTKFSELRNDIKAALIDFSMKQAAIRSFSDRHEIETLIDSAFAVFDRSASALVPIVPIYQYYIFSGSPASGEILPDDVRKNGVIYSSIFHLGSFAIDGYYVDNSSDTKVFRGYDVVYDLGSREIKLIYSIKLVEDGITTLYRVPADMYEDFNFNEFLIELSSMLLGKLEVGMVVDLERMEAA